MSIVHERLTSFRQRKTDNENVLLQGLLDEIIVEQARVQRNIVKAVQMLVAKNAWNEALRVAIAFGGYQQSDIADSLAVSRSTVARWFNGETLPAPQQMPAYADRLIQLLQCPRASFHVVPPRSMIG